MLKYDINFLYQNQDGMKIGKILWNVELQEYARIQSVAFSQVRQEKNIYVQNLDSLMQFE